MDKYKIKASRKLSAMELNAAWDIYCEDLELSLEATDLKHCIANGSMLWAYDGNMYETSELWESDSDFESWKKRFASTLLKLDSKCFAYALCFNVLDVPSELLESYYENSGDFEDSDEKNFPDKFTLFVILRNINLNTFKILQKNSTGVSELRSFNDAYDDLLNIELLSIDSNNLPISLNHIGFLTKSTCESAS